MRVRGEPAACGRDLHPLQQFERPLSRLMTVDAFVANNVYRPPLLAKRSIRATRPLPS
jgi:hypothetical protein